MYTCLRCFFTLFNRLSIPRSQASTGPQAKQDGLREEVEEAWRRLEIIKVIKSERCADDSVAGPVSFTSSIRCAGPVLCRPVSLCHQGRGLRQLLHPSESLLRTLERRRCPASKNAVFKSPRRFPRPQLLELQAEYHKNSHEFLSKNISELKENHSQTGEGTSAPLGPPLQLRLAPRQPLLSVSPPHGSGPPVGPSSQKVYGEPLMSHLTQSDREIAAPIQECIHMLLRTGMREEVWLRGGTWTCHPGQPRVLAKFTSPFPLLATPPLRVCSAWQRQPRW